MSLRRVVTRRSPEVRRHATSLDALVDEREFLRQSIEDLEVERASGEVDERDFAVLRARYCQRLDEVEAAICDLAPAEPPGVDQPGASGGLEDGEAPEAASLAPRDVATMAEGGPLRRRLGNRRVRLVIGLGAAVCFVVAATLLAASFAGVRLPGESATGSVSLSGAQQEQETLDRAAVLGSEGQAAEAVQLYNEVLKMDPDQPDALTYGGWLIRLAGLSAKNRLVLAQGDASVARAVKVAPGYPDAHALLGVILYEDFARPAQAVVQFRDALAVGASENLVASVAPVALKCFATARRPLPSRYAKALNKAAGVGGGG
ncbi:MAG: hypothetical protein ABSD97_07330 [Acidimicrobiales bacterium]|jgi:tetratricopeptide (TPR) repeat protein